MNKLKSVKNFKLNTDHYSINKNMEQKKLWNYKKKMPLYLKELIN